NRKKRSAAWAAWWTAHKATAALPDPQSAPATEPYRGYTLLILTNYNKIMEVDSTGKTRWEMAGLLNPWDAVGLPGERVLVTEYSGQRVTERNFKGEVLWQKQLTGPYNPMSAERLRNGNTFITCRNLLVEVNRRGREVFKWERPGNDILSARK